MRVNVIDGSVEPLDRLKAALEASGVVGIWAWHHVRDTVLYDRSAAKLLTGDPGLADTELDGDEAVTAVHPADQTWLREQMIEAAQSDGLVQAEYRVIAPEGKIRWLLSRGRTFPGATGQAVVTRGILIDITESYEIGMRLGIGTQDEEHDALDDLEAIADYAIIIRKRLDDGMSRPLHAAVDLLLFRIGCEIARRSKY